MDSKEQKNTNQNVEIVDENILEQALNDLENEDKLNLTHDDKEKDEEVDPELEKEYQDFLKSLNQEGGAGEEGDLNQFAKMMGNLLNGMKLEDDDPNNAGQAGSADKQLHSILKQLTGNVNDENFDVMAQGFLREFMDKDVLQEPLEEAKKNYETYLSEKEKDLNETDKKNYNEQYKCILQLLEVVDKEPENKEKMINIFEKMHDYGMPPEGILNPLSKAPFPGNPLGNPMGQAGPGGSQNPEDCNIF